MEWLFGIFRKWESGTGLALLIAALNKKEREKNADF